MAFDGEGMETSLTSESQGIIMTSSQGNKDSIINLKSDGNIILEKTVPYNFSNIIISSPEIKISQNYELSINNKSSKVQAQSEVTSGGMMRGFRNNFNANNSTDLAEIPEGSKNQSLDNSGSTPPEPPDGLTGEEPPELTDGSIQPPEEMENGNSDNLPEIPPNQNMEDNQNETN